MRINYFPPAFRWSVASGLVALSLGLGAGCTYSHGDPAPCNVAAETITYSKVVSPIFDANCRQCHGSNVAATLGGGNDFGNLQGIKRYPAADMLGSIQHTPTFDPMPKGRAKLSDCDILRIKIWIDAGQPDN